MGCSLFMSQTGNTFFKQIWFNKSKFFSLSRNLGPIYEFTEFSGGEIWDEYTEFNGGIYFFYFILETPFVALSATIQEQRPGVQPKFKRSTSNSTEVFNIDGVTANDVIQRNQHRKEKKNLSSVVITDVKLASQLKKDSEFCFSFLWQEHCHSKISGEWLCQHVSITALF